MLAFKPVRSALHCPVLVSTVIEKEVTTPPLLPAGQAIAVPLLPRVNPESAVAVPLILITPALIVGKPRAQVLVAAETDEPNSKRAPRARACARIRNMLQPPSDKDVAKSDEGSR